jgi:ribosomal protein S18 acetylase RimI-like enzyme
MTLLLDNVFWHSLAGHHARYAVGAVDARRYAPGISPIAGFASTEHPNLEALAAYCEPGEHFYCADWTGPMHPGWHLVEESTMFRMVWDAPMPAADEFPNATRLGQQHAPAALELATLTRPGPFGLGTLQLGEYFGHFVGTRLVAMAGERMYAGRYREISGVCTHPDFQGRGLAGRLMTKLIRRQVMREEIPFLHVMRSNERACQLYERMGFRHYSETRVRVITRN